MDVAHEPRQHSPELQQQFLQIQRNFIARLPLRLHEMQQARAQPQQLYTLLHQLTGAAGGYGFAELGNSARTAMNLIAAADADALDRALTQLQDLTDQICNTFATVAASKQV